MTRKVHKLKGFQPEQFFVICIASHQNHYRLSWGLNKTLGLYFQKTQDLEINVEKSEVKQYFSRYVSPGDNLEVSWNLISNKSEQGHLLKDQKNIDYILKIEGEVDEEFVQTIVQKLRKQEMIITAFELKPLSSVQHKKLTF